METLEFRILGPLEVWRAGHELELRPARQRALLVALLLRANQVVSSDRLIDELWGERPPDTAATALQSLVSQLRKVLEPERKPGAPGELIVTRAPGYVLRLAPDTVDALRFEQLAAEGRNTLAAGDTRRAGAALREALALWRGPALAGVDDTEEARTEARRLEELRLEALEDRVDADLAEGRNGTLIPELEALVEREPLRERPRSQLMLALYRSGRHADALAQYQKARRRFVEELGIEPSPRLRELEQAILGHDPELLSGLPRFRAPLTTRRRPSYGKLGLAAAAVAALGVGAAWAWFGRPDGGPDEARLALATSEVQPGTVAVVDAKTARVVDSVEVGSDPVALAAGHGSVWVASRQANEVLRIDTESGDVTRTIAVASPVDLVATDDAVWVASGTAGTVSRIDPLTNDVVATIDLDDPDPSEPTTVHGIAADGRAVWAAVSGGGLRRIDPRTNRAGRPVDVGEDQLAVAVAHDSVWVATTRGRLLQLAPGTGRTISGLAMSAGWISDIVGTEDNILALADDIWVIDPQVGRVYWVSNLRSFVMAVVDEPGPGLWAVTSDGVLARLVPGFDTPTALVKLTPNAPILPRALTVTPGRVWVALGRRPS